MDPGQGAPDGASPVLTERQNLQYGKPRPETNTVESFSIPAYRWVVAAAERKFWMLLEGVRVDPFMLGKFQYVMAPTGNWRPIYIFEFNSRSLSDSKGGS